MAEEIGAAGAEIHWTLLAEFSHTGTLSAGNKWESSYSLEKDECAEITHFVVHSPVSGGVEQDLLYVVPVIDKAGIEEYVLFPGRYSLNLQPIPTNLHGAAMQLGSVERTMLYNTTLKAKDSIGVRVYAGASDVTAPFRIQVYGVLYKKDEALRAVYGDTIYGEAEVIEDRTRGKSLEITKDAVDVSIDNFDRFVGGVRQNKPIVMPFVRFARNKEATTANVLYEFNYLADETEAWENLYFDFDDREALFIKRMGIKYNDHLSKFGIKLGDRVYPKPSMFSVSTAIMNFGHAYPLYPSDMPVFLPLPELKQGYLIHDEKGRIVAMDDGTPIAAGGVIVAASGVRVSL